MLAMAERKKPRKPGRPATGRKQTVTIQARVSPELHAALETMCATTRRTKNVEMVIALEAHLAAAGVWPGGKPKEP